MAGETIGRKNVGFTEAINYARKRNVVLPDEYYGKLIGVQRSQAISVAGLASIEQIKFVVDQLDKVLKEGKSFKEFQEAVRANELGIDLPRHRLDNIFRTNIQASYARGRHEQQTRVKASRPYLMYDAINDGRTRPHHHAMDNTLLHRDHPWWKTNYPPNGYRCRCTVISLTEAQAQKRGISDAPPDADPDEGWEYHPGADYALPVKRTLDKTVDKVVSRVPAATKAAQKAKKAIEQAAKPVTLDNVLARGKRAMSELDKGDYNTEGFYKRLEDRVLKHVTGKEVARTATGRVAPDFVAEHARKHFTKSLLVNNKAPGLADDAFKAAVHQRMPLPRSWLKAADDFFKNGVALQYSPNRAFARQSQWDPLLSIDPSRGDVVLHEFIHLIQIAKPELQDLARQFHLKRTAGATQKRLKDLFPNTAYGLDEVAKEDQYYAAYMGREYFVNGRWEPLEILTMATQALLGDPTSSMNKYSGLRRNMLAKDRETAEFILGLLLSYA